MKRVAIVLNTSWNIYNFRLGLLKTLKSKGYKIICIAPEDGYHKKIKDMDFDYFHININNKGTNPIEDIKLIYNFYKLYKKIKPDIILHYTIKPNIYGSIGAKLLNIPSISNISGLGTVFLNDNFSSKVAKLLYKIALKFPKKVFFQNRDDYNLFIDRKLIKKERSDILPGSGINIEYFKPKESYEVSFLMIARLVKDKGLMEYLEACKSLKENANPKFYLLGSFYKGNPTAISEKELQKYIDNNIIEYLGTSDNVKEVIEKYDCIVLPLIRERKWVKKGEKKL